MISVVTLLEILHQSTNRIIDVSIYFFSIAIVNS